LLPESCICPCVSGGISTRAITCQSHIRSHLHAQFLRGRDATPGPHPAHAHIKYKVPIIGTYIKDLYSLNAITDVWRGGELEIWRSAWPTANHTRDILTLYSTFVLYTRELHTELKNECSIGTHRKRRRRVRTRVGTGLKCGPAMRFQSSDPPVVTLDVLWCMQEGTKYFCFFK